MSKIVLGVTSTGKPFAIDLELLLDTRLLLQANSGGGKSYGIRRLIEQLFGKVQIILIDREGEFKSLREKYDFLLVGHGGDIPAHIGSARLLAEKLLESGVSAICDLYEVFRTRAIDRMAWAREFLMGLVDAPKHLWHDVIVIVDEAHLLCPQVEPKGRNMEEREIISGCKEAMIALATVGRKRVQCAVWATQRLAKLDKDATAELLNRMVGMTMEDQDVDRAVDLMSVSREDRLSFRRSLRDLEPGQFYAFGRAISKERILVKVGKAETHHEAAGRKHVDYSPPTPAKIQALLSKFEGLPQEIVEKARTEAELRKENQTLRGQVATLQRQGAAKPTPQAPVKTVVQTKVEIKELPIFQASDLKMMGKVLERFGEFRKNLKGVVELDDHLSGFMVQVGDRLLEAKHAAEAIRKTPDPAPKMTGSFLTADAIPGGDPRIRNFQALNDRQAKEGVSAVRASVRAIESRKREISDTEGPLNKPQLRQLQGLAEYLAIGIQRVARPWLAGWLGLSLSGSFKNNFSSLRVRGLIDYDSDTLYLTQAGIAAAPPSRLEITPQAILDRCCLAVSGPEGKMLRHLHEAHPQWLDRDALAAALGVVMSGSFKNGFSHLHASGMIDYGEGVNKGRLKCADWMFVGTLQGV